MRFTRAAAAAAAASGALFLALDCHFGQHKTLARLTEQKLLLLLLMLGFDEVVVAIARCEQKAAVLLKCNLESDLVYGVYNTAAS